MMTTDSIFGIVKANIPFLIDHKFHSGFIEQNNKNK